MRYIADLHIHSAYSYATSKNSHIPLLYCWAQLKGLDLIGTGDFMHPLWLKELQEYLQPKGNGFFSLQEQATLPPMPLSIEAKKKEVSFILTCEISCIYKKNGKTRRVHHVVCVPTLQDVEKLIQKLTVYGKLASDGRPIVKIPSYELLSIVLETSKDGFLFPAHTWTPWYGILGAKTGYDSIEECFEDLTPYVFAIETGLSSDPQMNRQVASLDKFTLISNSDCHSPQKLGREANVFNCEFSFLGMKKAIQNPKQGMESTIEFYPEEGKYHIDGHRKCNISWHAEKTRENEGICPVCNKPVTIGTLHRLSTLATRKEPLFNKHHPTVRYLLSLESILAEICRKQPTTKQVKLLYKQALELFDSEIEILLYIPLEELKTHFAPPLMEAISRMREGKVYKENGFDGQYGRISVFTQQELESKLNIINDDLIK